MRFPDARNARSAIGTPAAGEPVVKHAKTETLDQERAATRAEKFSAGRGFLAGQFLLVIALGLACSLRAFPWYGAVAFLPLLYRGFAWFARKSAPLAVRALGWSELAYAVGFGVLLIWGVRGLL